MNVRCLAMVTTLRTKPPACLQLWAIIAAHVDEIWRFAALNAERYSAFGPTLTRRLI